MAVGTASIVGFVDSDPAESSPWSCTRGGTEYDRREPGSVANGGSLTRVARLLRDIDGGGTTMFPIGRSGTKAVERAFLIKIPGERQR